MQPWQTGTALAGAVVLAALVLPDQTPPPPKALRVVRDLDVSYSPLTQRDNDLVVLRGVPSDGPVVAQVHVTVPPVANGVVLSGCGLTVPLQSGSRADLQVDHLPCTLWTYVVGGSLRAYGNPIVVTRDGMDVRLDAPPWTPGGIGVTFAPARVIGALLPGGPADRAGLRIDDQIVAVDGDSLDGVSSDQAPKRIIGPAGDDVTLTIARGDQRFDVTLTREVVSFPHR